MLVSAQGDIFECLILSNKRSKTQRLKNLYHIKQMQILTFEKLDPENIWHLYFPQSIWSQEKLFYNIVVSRSRPLRLQHLFSSQVPHCPPPLHHPPPIMANWTPCEPLALYCPPSMTLVQPEERNIALIHSAHTQKPNVVTQAGNHCYICYKM